MLILKSDNFIQEMSKLLFYQIKSVIFKTPPLVLILHYYI